MLLAGASADIATGRGAGADRIARSRHAAADSALCTVSLRPPPPRSHAPRQVPRRPHGLPSSGLHRRVARCRTRWAVAVFAGDLEDAPRNRTWFSHVSVTRSGVNVTAVGSAGACVAMLAGSGGTRRWPAPLRLLGRGRARWRLRGAANEGRRALRTGESRQRVLGAAGVCLCVQQAASKRRLSLLCCLCGGRCMPAWWCRLWRCWLLVGSE